MYYNCINLSRTKSVSFLALKIPEEAEKKGKKVFIRGTYSGHFSREGGGGWFGLVVAIQPPL